MKLRNKFRERREELGLSIVDMAKKSGLSRPTIMKYENSNENQITKFLNAYKFRLEPIKPAEPLIKDEKIRKAVRVWADASGIEKVLSYGDVFWIGFRSTNTESVWKFECNYIDGLEFKQDKEYTITELCGEEEE